jgi:uncharacterized protein (TIGR00725 family)
MSSSTYVSTHSKLKRLFKFFRGSGQAQPAYAGMAYGFCMQIAVIGHGQATHGEYEEAYAAGRTIAKSGAVLVCGGLGGVMEAACRGAQEAGGTTVGILPGTEGGNPYLDITIRTGLGHARNVLVALSADAVIAVGGKYGTLSEIAIALKAGRPVYGLGTWDIEGVIPCSSPEDAVIRAVPDASPGPHKPDSCR